MKHLIFSSLLLILSFPVLGSELYTPQSVLHTPQDHMIASVKFANPETGDMYVAAILRGELFFLNENGEWTTTPSPFLANKTFQNEYPLFSIEAGVLPDGNYSLYQVVIVPQGNPYNIEDWIGGIEGLNFLTFSVGLPNTHGVTVLPFSKGGMHCMNKEFSIFAILPPSNTVNAQVLLQNEEGMPQFLEESQVDVRYTAVLDRLGSINSSSIGKTDFWTHATDLLGVALPEGEGVTGAYMPADHPQNPGSQDFHYNTQQDWFSAKSIPIVPIDDRRQFNPYPMLRMSAHDKETGELLAATDVVLPVSSQIGCSNCHATGESAAKDVSISWANDTDINIQSKKNILILHDHEEGTDLYNQTPVLCADCHYSAAIDFTGAGPQGLQQHLPLFSQVMHKFHGELRNTEGEPIFPSTLEVSASQSCYQCHPSQTSACQRGAMRTAGLECSSCHGDLLAVGGKFPLLEGGSIDGNNDGQARRPWRDLPRCQSCHTGDVINYLTGDDLEFFEDGLRLIQTYKTGDNSASSILAENQRFAENEHTLYRNSKGHHGVACEACHGSTHAIWSNADTTANDNLTALQLQGHAGTIIECDTCHATDSLPLTLEGPHGLHNVNDMRWTNGHASFYNNDNQACQACHGLNLEGTALSKMAVTRNISGVELKKGQKVSCDLCHGQP